MRVLALLVAVALVATVRPPPRKVYPLDFSRLQKLMDTRPEIVEENLHIGLYRQSPTEFPESIEEWKGSKGIGPKLYILYLTILNDGLGWDGGWTENSVRVVIPRGRLRELKRNLISEVVRLNLHKSGCQTLEGWTEEDWKARTEIERLGIVLRLPKDMKHDPGWRWAEAEYCILDLKQDTEGARSMRNWFYSNVLDFYVTATRTFPPKMEKDRYGLSHLVTRLSETQYLQIAQTLKAAKSTEPTSTDK